MAKNKIRVQFGQLTKPLVSKSVDEGSTLSQFCEANGVEYSSAVRVNAMAVSSDYVLKEGDIITAIDDVDGG